MHTSRNLLLCVLMIYALFVSYNSIKILGTKERYRIKTVSSSDGCCCVCLKYWIFSSHFVTMRLLARSRAGLLEQKNGRILDS